jgi:large subunit ribosomal protein L24
MTNIKLHRGDMVRVVAGNARGATGKILRVHPATNKVTVEGVHQVKRSVKAGPGQPRGTTKEIHLPIHASNVAILQPGKAGKTSRIGYVLDKDGNKARVYRQANNKEIE